jgi:hypothetical protein
MVCRSGPSGDPKSRALAYVEPPVTSPEADASGPDPPGLEGWRCFKGQLKKRPMAKANDLGRDRENLLLNLGSQRVATRT